ISIIKSLSLCRLKKNLLSANEIVFPQCKVTAVDLHENVLWDSVLYTVSPERLQDITGIEFHFL
uniref:Uncharacterized protein n=1 Tax=Monopterus albus TaxID=43700 RepID=A0A3Q3JPA7_MONAL